MHCIYLTYHLTWQEWRDSLKNVHLFITLRHGTDVRAAFLFLSEMSGIYKCFSSMRVSKLIIFCSFNDRWYNHSYNSFFREFGLRLTSVAKFV